MMSERFSYTLEQTNPDGSVAWNQEILNNTLDEHYVTAIDDTQYLSVLDTSNEISLDLNLTNPKVEIGEYTELESEPVTEDQVVLYTLEGSDEVFGIQLARDEEGVLRKYQFQFRRNEADQLEAMPETVQILPLDDSPIQQPDFDQDRTFPTYETIQNEALEGTTEDDENVEQTLLYEEHMEDVKPVVHFKEEAVHEELTEFEEYHEDLLHEEVGPLEQFTEIDRIPEEIESPEQLEVSPELPDSLEEPEEDYQVVEGFHITGDMELPIKNNNILKQVLKAPNHELKKESRLYLYVVPHPEKENLENFGGQTKSVNPRSVLKSSQELLQSHECKRFLKRKEHVQARNFNNFINKTTIPQAPVRKDRLPRKQQIKPVARQDEEIVVQEMVVSSKGFVEAVDKDLLTVTGYVELSDSDDDYEPMNGHRRRRSNRRQTIIIESDSDSVIELDSDSEAPRKRRGRPPKPKPAEPEKKPEIPCPNCTKTFPSQNSLKTHLQHHNLLNKTKYKCETCNESFKNRFLQLRHDCPRFTCKTCQKRFHTLRTLHEHERGHVKNRMFKNTSMVTVSPKKMKALDRRIQRNLCTNCGKLCSSLENLKLHMLTHKAFQCGSCRGNFSSKVLLDAHIRGSCVKFRQVPNKRNAL